MFRQIFSKTTIQAGVVALVAVVASAGFLMERLPADQFVLLVVMAFGWAFKANNG